MGRACRSADRVEGLCRGDGWAFHLLLALVLGLLVFTAFSVYTTQQTEAQSLGPVVIELDVLLEDYTARCGGGRTGLREALGRARKRFSAM